MKKLLLLFGCIISVLSSAQEIDKPYEFPVKPGTEQWAKLISSQQMDEVCVIPDQALKLLSTKALLITCLNVNLQPAAYWISKNWFFKSLLAG
jgi:hypothetical protein